MVLFKLVVRIAALVPIGVVELVDGIQSALVQLELQEGVALGLAVLVSDELARQDVAEATKLLYDIRLVHVALQIFYYQIGVRVEVGRLIERHYSNDFVFHANHCVRQKLTRHMWIVKGDVGEARMWLLDYLDHFELHRGEKLVEMLFIRVQVEIAEVYGAIGLTRVVVD